MRYFFFSTIIIMEMIISPVDWNDVLCNLERGLFHLQNLMNKLKVCMDQQKNETSVIKNILEPLTEMMQSEIKAMLEKAEKILFRSNQELEKSEHRCVMMNQDIKKLDEQLKDLSIELNRKKKEEECAIAFYNEKKSQLSRAEDALRSAERKLDEAKTAQAATIATGTTVATVSAIASIVFPPALLGVAGGAVTSVVGLTVLEEAVDNCRSTSRQANSEVTDSRNSLEKAEKATKTTKEHITNIQQKQDEKQRELNELNKEIESKKEFQKRVIELNERIKKTYAGMSMLHGRVNIIHCETKGGYCVVTLLSPLKDVCESVKSLVWCSSIEYFTEETRMNELRSRVNAVMAIKYPVREDSDLDLI